MAGMDKGGAGGAVIGGVRALLRLEGLALFAAMRLLYALGGGSWWIFVVLVLLPDISFAAYLAGPGTGALTGCGGPILPRRTGGPRPFFLRKAAFSPSGRAC